MGNTENTENMRSLEEGTVGAGAAGTEETELMRFFVGEELYGVPIDRIREIMVADRVKPVPHSLPSVEGFFKPREEMITVVNLGAWLTGGPAEQGPRDLFIVTAGRKSPVAFRVSRILGISRLPREAVTEPDSILSNGSASAACGITQCEGKLVTILDFDAITEKLELASGNSEGGSSTVNAAENAASDRSEAEEGTQL